jgi:protein-S-isoprenylcysteine O-methyltransferase Ste14
VSSRAWVVTVVPLVGLAVFLALFPRGPWTGLCIFGALLAVVGFALVTVARLQLGDSFSVAPKATQLVERGLYSRIRHPVYVFSALGVTGLILYVGELSLLIVVVFIVAVQVARARREESVLEETFGERYRRYRERTWF